jgi:membrane protein required for colicin V production
MTPNALDIILIAVLLVTLILGLIKGFVRQIIGIIAVVAGLILAANYYPLIFPLFQRFISSVLVSNFLGFLLIFGAVLLAGWLLGLLVSKLIKGPLAFINHVWGGVIGFVKGVLICGVLVFALLVFEVQKDALAGSRLAPFCLQVTRAIVNLIPRDLKAKFKTSYEEMRGRGGSHGQKI